MIFEHDWLKWSHDKCDAQTDNRLGLRFYLQFTQGSQETTNSLPGLKP